MMAGQHIGIPGVEVTLTDSSGVVVSTTTTNENGEYLFRGLAAGAYTLTAHSPQHDPVAHTITLFNGSAARHDIEFAGLCELTGAVRLAAPMPAAPVGEAAAATPRTGPSIVPDPAPATHGAASASSHGPRKTEPVTEDSPDGIVDPSGRLVEEADRGSDRPDAASRLWRRRAGSRVGLVILVVAAVVAASGGLAYSRGWVDNLLGTDAPALAATGPVATAVVEFGTIARTESWSGTLDYGMPVTVTSAAEGIITRLPSQGEFVEHGDTLYHLNEQPVALLNGVVPMYRNLAVGDSGADVEQLEANLAALGYDGFTVDDEYTESTAEAVRSWQEEIGAEPTGEISRVDIVFLPEGGRVDSLHVGIGDTVTPGTPILDLAGADRVVSLTVDVNDRNRFEVGAELPVMLPGGEELMGTVSTTAVIEVRSEGQETEPVLAVGVTLDEDVPDEFLGGPADVIVAIDERADILLVPVNALLALAGGGYGLEVVNDDGATSTVAVSTGLFADGQVQVEGDGITEGTVVGRAGR